MKRTTASKTVYSNTADVIIRDFFYSTPDNAVLEDLSLHPTIYRVYNYLKKLADVKTQQTFVKVATLAKAIGRSRRTVQYALKTLHEKGIITRIFRKSESSPKYNISSLFIIHGRFAPCYSDEENHTPQGVQVIAPMGATDCTQELEPPVQEKNQKHTLTREAETTPAGNTDVVITTTADTPVEQAEADAVPEEWQGYDEEAKEMTKLWEQFQTEDEDEALEAKTPEPSAKAEELVKATTSLILDQQNTETPEPSTKDEVMEKADHIDSTEAPTTAVLRTKGKQPRVETPKPAVPEGVPDIMRPTAEYFMFKFGRKSMSSYEAKLLRKLETIHTPTRINRAIDEAAERLSAKPIPLKANSFGYIYRMLEHQNSIEATRAKKKSSKRNVKASQSAPNTTQVHSDVCAVSELSMPVEEAKRVITEYAPAEKKTEQMPQAMTEFLTQLRQKSQQVWDEYEGSLPHDEDDLPIWPEYETDKEAFAAGKMTVADYLRVKFPNASDEELSTEKLRPDELRGLELAMEIDEACALCGAGDSCFLPDGCDRTHARPIVMLKPDLRGRKVVTIGYGGCIKCKHECGQPKPDPDFERRVKASGLTPKQASKTFASYDASSSELVVAKAQAILSAKNGTNLILSGKAGTGKTHLAVAIAIEAMRAGRNAIVNSLPDMLEDICRAYQEHTDPFGLMKKYKTIPCLVLDDWGKERTSEARLDYLYQIIDYRYKHGLQTIATTNARNMEGLKSKFNADRIEPLVSRILENGEWVTITSAPNYRMAKRSSHVTSESNAEGVHGDADI